MDPGFIHKTLTGLFPLTWQDGIGGDLVDYSITGASGGRHKFVTSITNILQTADRNLVFRGYTKKYRSVTIDDTWVNKDICWEATNSDNLMIIDNDYSSAEEFKSAMSGVYLYYQRDTDESWYIQNKTIYRTTQLTANQNNPQDHRRTSQLHFTPYGLFADGRGHRGCAEWR